GAADGFDYTAELDDRTVAGPLNHAPVVDSDRRVDEVAAQTSEPRQRALLVGARQPAVASDLARVGAEDSSGKRASALDKVLDAWSPRVLSVVRIATALLVHGAWAHEARAFPGGATGRAGSSAGDPDRRGGHRGRRRGADRGGRLHPHRRLHRLRRNGGGLFHVARAGELLAGGEPGRRRDSVLSLFLISRLRRTRRVDSRARRRNVAPEVRRIVAERSSILTTERRAVMVPRLGAADFL